MNKQAMAVGELAKWVIAIAVLVLLVSIFFIGPQALFTKVKSIIPRADILQQKGTGETGDYKTRPDIEVGRVVFNEIVLGFTSLMDDEAKNCFYYLPENMDYKTLFDKFTIKIMKTDTGASFILNKKFIESGKELTSTDSIITIADVSPCLVYGTPHVKNFYEYWLSGEKRDTVPLKDYATQTTMTLKYETIITAIGESLDWDTEPSSDPGSYVIYKHKDGVLTNNICLIPTTARTGFLNYRGCNHDGMLLNDDCFNKNKDTSLYKIAEANEDIKVWNSINGVCE